MPTFGNLFTYEHLEIVADENKIVYYGLTDDDTYAVFNITNGTIQIFDDEGEGGRIRVVA